jgi:hypothetical protein
MVRRAELPAYTIAGRLRFKTSDVDAALERVVPPPAAAAPVLEDSVRRSQGRSEVGTVEQLEAVEAAARALSERDRRRERRRARRPHRERLHGSSRAWSSSASRFFFFFFARG